VVYDRTVRLTGKVKSKRFPAGPVSDAFMFVALRKTKPIVANSTNIVNIFFIIQFRKENIFIISFNTIMLN